MMLMAVPLYLLFEIGIVGMRLWGKKEDPLNKDEDE
jgi:Sec-independent protein secretion pathway component TatC